ncbi:MAG: hypothetical protein Q9166_004540 [cf. Caloplaca sp. 2 TL-2023]
MAIVAVKTASEEDSIWRGLGEDSFRRNFVALAKRTDSVPVNPKTYSWKQRQISHPEAINEQHILSVQDEQRLADDIAYLAASREGVEAVTAVALEERAQPTSLVIRLAANASIPDDVLVQVDTILGLLHDRAMEGVLHYRVCSHFTADRLTVISKRECLSSLFKLVISVNRARIHGRLRSTHWIVPAHMLYQSKRKDIPLYQCLQNLVPSLQKDSQTRWYADKLNCLCHIYEKINNNSADNIEEIRLLQNAVKKSFDLYRMASEKLATTASSSSTTRSYVRSVVHQNKDIQQVNKIGHYWGLCVFLTKAAQRYPGLFAHTTLQHISPYQSIQSSVYIQAPRGRKHVDCFVHAEIQLITFYEMSTDQAFPKPRALGVSKDACYLCDLFIKAYGQFSISKSHGRLYDKWTVPDLANFNDAQRRNYRRIIQHIHQACTSARRSRSIWRPYPLTSTLDLPDNQPLSSVASSVGIDAPLDLPLEPLSEGNQLLQPITSLDASLSSLPVSASSPIPEDIEDASDGQVPISSPPSGNVYMANVIEPHQRQSTHSIARPRSSGGSRQSTPVSVMNGEIDLDPSVGPIERAITQESPFSIKICGMRMSFETETSRMEQVSVSIRHGKSGAVDDVIDVQAMTPGEIVDLYRDDVSAPFRFDIYKRPQQLVRVEMDRLPSEGTEVC